MKNLIILSEPYSSDWSRGYLNTNTEGRRTLTLYNSNANRSSTQYARYLLSVKLGRYLTKDEEVDHIDGDKTNDSISNLQILGKKQNRQKSNPTTFIKGFCYICGVEIIKRKSDLRSPSKKLDLKNGLLTCSRSCGYVKAAITLKNSNQI